MPEIAEVARVVHFLRQHLVGKKVRMAIAQEDSSVFGKVGTTGPEVAAALMGKKVVSAGSQGKYFWLVLEKPPHLVMHLGMTGWVHLRGIKSAYTNYYKKMKPGEEDQWPPKYAKLQLETEGPNKVEVAYTDPRRFGRIRLVDCPGDEIRKRTPLVENGPDPVVDADVFTREYFAAKMTARRVPIKALLLDQTVISGIGNWVGDEVLFQARLHPERYSNECSEAEVGRLYDAVRDVCRTAVDELGDSDEFPAHWLFNYRWGKGGKPSRLPDGEPLAFVTVGGRTSCFAPALQKNKGALPRGAKVIKEESEEVEKKEEIKAKEQQGSDKDEEPPASKRRRVAKDAKAKPVASKGSRQSSSKRPEKKEVKEEPGVEAAAEDSGKRRSGRLRGIANGKPTN
ncbi:hypothetical protein RB601_009156 [Gaeumannomyces tritici]